MSDQDKPLTGPETTRLLNELGIRRSTLKAPEPVRRAIREQNERKDRR